MPKELTKTNGKRQLIPLVYATPPGALSVADIHNFARNHPAEFVDMTARSIEKGDISLSKIEDWPGLYRALAGVNVPTMVIDPVGVKRVINVGAFPMLTGNVSIAAINAEYDAQETIGQDLVTEMDSNKDLQVVVSIHALGHNKPRVDETEDFPLVGSMEEWVTIGSRSNGLRSAITAKLIRENDIANITQRLTSPGEIASEMIEEQTLRRVTDADGSHDTSAEPKVYRPLGVGTQLYNSTANNPGTRAPSGTREDTNALVDETNLEKARLVLDAMLNARGKRINVWKSGQMVLLVPRAIFATMLKIQNSEMVSGVVNEFSAWGSRGQWRPQIVSSTKLDDISTTAWYLGNFKKQFTRKWNLRMELVTLAMDPATYLRSAIAYESRIQWSCEIGALDYVHVVQNLEGTAYQPS